MIEFAENQKENPEIAFDKERDKMIVVFDGDIFATKAISTVLPKQYQVKDVPQKQGKDYNDLLCIKLNLAITKREKTRKRVWLVMKNMRDRR